VQIHGEFWVDANPARVWGILMDPETICTLAASCEEARQLDETRYEGKVRVKLGFMQVRARVAGEVLEKNEPASMAIQIEGDTQGLLGRFRGLAHLDMSEVEGRTRGRYTFDMQILGRLDSIGRPFLQMTAQHVATSFAAKMSRHLR